MDFQVDANTSEKFPTYLFKVKLSVFDVATKYRRVMWINKGSHRGNGPSALGMVQTTTD
jgi:hypothetical protein